MHWHEKVLKKLLYAYCDVIVVAICYSSTEEKMAYGALLVVVESVIRMLPVSLTFFNINS